MSVVSARSSPDDHSTVGAGRRSADRAAALASHRRQDLRRDRNDDEEGPVERRDEAGSCHTSEILAG